ncbi:hypothetical protein [Aliivibrio finisterrensis]|uniref:Uncharacterized protein n=1 Tax=Aliivibrio finisterrensis TaxID=511998 RepID=A0ABY0I6V4_9GAMM|nr:hypothetical protein [Aliivibrio finisterrensis]RYU62170.1 hypothetical protein ERW53_16790 [Aliivibrio finisterrensis]RYU84480.1 hypothetical protein ERW52_10955 [Aliivibrio finisterrensis]
MKVWTVPDAAKAFPIGVKVKYFLDISNKDDFHEGVISSEPRIVRGEVAVLLDGYVGSFSINHLELSE